jgi:hypothetical protein
LKTLERVKRLEVNDLEFGHRALLHVLLDDSLELLAEFEASASFWLFRELRRGGAYRSCAFQRFNFSRCVACGGKLGGSYLTNPFARV